jgi:hypothetical protein
MPCLGLLNLVALYREDAQRIRKLIEQRLLDRDPSRECVFHMSVSCELNVGAPMRLNIERMRETERAETHAKIMRVVQMGAAIEGPVFGHLMGYRFSSSLQTVVLLLDEMRTKVDSLK